LQISMCNPRLRIPWVGEGEALLLCSTLDASSHIPIIWKMYLRMKKYFCTDFDSRPYVPMVKQCFSKVDIPAVLIVPDCGPPLLLISATCASYRKEIAFRHLQLSVLCPISMAKIVKYHLLQMIYGRRLLGEVHFYWGDPSAD